MSELANVSSSLIMHEFVQKLEVSRWAEFALWVVVFTVGVPGNLLILCVYRAKRARISTHVFIGALAVADLLTCLLRIADAVAIALVSHFLDYDHQNVIYFLSRGFMYTTSLLTTAIAFDRFDAVCRSLRRTITLRRAKIGAAACFVVGFAGIIPEAGYQINSDLNDEEDTFIRSVVKFIPVFLYIISLFAVTVFYSLILVFVRKRGKISARDSTQQQAVGTIGGNIRHQTQRTLEGGSNSVFAGSTESQQPPDTDAGLRGEGTSSSTRLPEAERQATKRQRINSRSRTTKMLFIATFLFFILWFPNVYLKVYALGSLFADFLKSSDHANWVAALLVLRDITYFNSVINAFIYGMANKRFRVECQAQIQRLRVRL